MIAVSTLLALAMAVAADGPPILQPGAPGEPTREISAERSRALSQTRHTAADTRFMQHMIVHHQQAVDMVALIEGRTSNASIIAIGGRIARSQDDEIALMRDWLMRRGEALEADDLHEHHGAGGHDHHHAHHASDDPDDVPLMTGMLSVNQMRALAAAEGGEFDRLFLEGMIHHHEGALIMVDELLEHPGAAEDIIMSDFTGHIVADQMAEILRMQNLLRDLPPAEEREAEPHSHHHHHHH
ncbi:MAG: DUF305 domain-containing protein [Glycocaulis sp.]